MSNELDQGLACPFQPTTKQINKFVTLSAVEVQRFNFSDIEPFQGSRW
jgi:hypothetical protein